MYTPKADSKKKKEKTRRKVQTLARRLTFCVDIREPVSGKLRKLSGEVWKGVRERGLVRMFTFRQKKEKKLRHGNRNRLTQKRERERVSGSGTRGVFYPRETVMGCLSYELPAWF